MSREIVEMFVDKNEYDRIMSSNEYGFFEIDECTIPALQNKCNIIISRQSVDYQPLKLEKVEPIGMYIMTYYTKKW